jgi:hypothetical protein
MPCENQPAQFLRSFFFKTQLSDAAVAVAAAECLSSVLNKSPFFGGQRLGNIMSAI